MQYKSKAASYTNSNHHNRKNDFRRSGRFIKTRCAKAERANSRTTIKQFLKNS